MRSGKQKAIAYGSAAIVGFVVIVLVIGVATAWVGVGTGEVGVEKNRGAVTGNVMQPGWHYINPATESVVKIDTRPRTETMSGDSAIPLLTGDGQDVEMDLSVRYRVEEGNADTFHSEYRNHNKALNDLIRPTVRSNSRHEASSLRANEIITREGRTTLEDTVEESLNENTQNTGITIEAVQVRDVRLNEDYGNALENVEIENTKAEQKQIRAQADRDAYQTRTEGLSDEVLMEKYIDSIDESDTVVLATGENGQPIIMDVGEGGTTQTAADAGSASQNESGGENESGGDTGNESAA